MRWTIKIAHVGHSRPPYGKRHKTLATDADPLGTQAILQTKRWLPNRSLIFVADSGFAALDLLAAVRRHVCVITRLRLDASLVQTTAATPERAAGPSFAEGARPAKAQRRAGQSENRLDIRGCLAMV